MPKGVGDFAPFFNEACLAPERMFLVDSTINNNSICNNSIVIIQIAGTSIREERQVEIALSPALNCILKEEILEGGDDFCAFFEDFLKFSQPYEGLPKARK